MTLNQITKTFDGIAVAHMQCWCGISFAVPDTLRRHYQAKAGQFTLYCPLGHGMVPGGPSEADRLRDELTREKHRTEQAQADAEWQRRRVEARNRQLAARKGQITKIKNRVRRGVCPCCGRYFENLHRHMEAKHADWLPEADLFTAEVPVIETVEARPFWIAGAEAAALGEPASANPHPTRGRWAYRRHAWDRGHAAQLAAPVPAEAPDAR